jgi:peptidyl-prolyl cis-trans isomerase-like 1
MRPPRHLFLHAFSYIFSHCHPQAASVLVCAVVCCLGLVLHACLRQEQPERFAKLLQASPKLPAALAARLDSLANADTIPRATHRLRVRTSKGAFALDLYGSDAPKTVENFILLAKRKFYDKTLVHRIARDFMIQGGDPKTKDKRKKDEWGSGGESVFGEPFADELNPDTPSFRRGYRRGVLCMANRGAGTNTSQFFICLRDLPELPHQYTIFGVVSEGIAVVEAIGAEPITPVLNETDGRPVKAVVVWSVRVGAVLR